MLATSTTSVDVAVTAQVKACVVFNIRKLIVSLLKKTPPIVVPTHLIK